MFSLRFFGGFKPQKISFLASDGLAPQKLSPAVARQLDGLVTTLLKDDPQPQEQGNIWATSIHSVRSTLRLSVLSNCASAFCVLASLLASKAVLDHAQVLPVAISYAFAFLAAELLDNFITFFEMQRRTQVARGIQLHLFTRVNRKLLEIDPSVGGALSKGNLKTLIASDVEAVEDFITAASANWIPTLVLMVLLTPVVYWMSGILGMIGLGTALIQIPLSVVFARLIERYQDKAQSQQDDLTTIVGEWVKNIRLVRYLGWQREIENEIESKVYEFTFDSSLRHVLVCITYGISYSWWMAPIVVMLFASERLNIPLELSTFFSSIWALNHLNNYIQNIPHSISMYGAAVAGVKRINLLLSAPELRRFIVPSTSAAPGGKVSKVRLSNVTVVASGRTLLSVADFELDLRLRTAVVGTVGSGKTIFLELITGERAPTSGTVEVQFENEAWRNLWEEKVYGLYRESFAFSQQQPFLSNATLRKNIDLGDTLTDDAINDAIASAQLKQDLELFPKGLYEEVGETGINLSGGQKQRVSLARAFASQRKIFILDDPLSAVDRATEQKLMQEILSHTEGLVLVSHRLDELSACNRIVVLEAGSVVEDASPQVLLADAGSAFNRFLQASREQGEAHD